jgi:hypothetical protein
MRGQKSPADAYSKALETFEGKLSELGCSSSRSDERVRKPSDGGRLPRREHNFFFLHPFSNCCIGRIEPSDAASPPPSLYVNTISRPSWSRLQNVRPKMIKPRNKERRSDQCFAQVDYSFDADSHYRLGCKMRFASKKSPRRQEKNATDAQIRMPQCCLGCAKSRTRAMDFLECRTAFTSNSEARNKSSVPCELTLSRVEAQCPCYLHTWALADATLATRKKRL